MSIYREGLRFYKENLNLDDCPKNVKIAFLTRWIVTVIINIIE